MPAAVREAISKEVAIQIAHLDQKISGGGGRAGAGSAAGGVGASVTPQPLGTGGTGTAGPADLDQTKEVFLEVCREPFQDPEVRPTVAAAFNFACDWFGVPF